MNKEFLKTLLETPSPSGYEGIASRLFMSEMIEDYPNLKRDNMNNIVISNGITDRESILFSAHIDSISMMVTNITKEGFIAFMSNGGIDRKVMLGARVDIIADDGTLHTGVIGKKPIHTEWKTPDYDKVTPIDEMLIDIGYSNKEDIEALGIHVGSLVIFSRGTSILDFGKGGGLICSPDLDDKIGVYIVTEVGKRLKNHIDHNIKLVAFVGEEQGLRGAKVAAKNLNVQESIDIDVTFDTSRDMGYNINSTSEVFIGEGPVIVYGGDKNLGIIRKLEEVAKENNIPFQRAAAMPGGTNTAAIQEVCTTDCKTAHVAIALRNMHTQQEIVSWRDVENCIELLVRYVESQGE